MRLPPHRLQHQSKLKEDSRHGQNKHPFDDVRCHQPLMCQCRQSRGHPVPLSVISEGMGHNSEVTTQISTPQWLQSLKFLHERLGAPVSRLFCLATIQISKQEILIQFAKLRKNLEMRAETFNQILYVLQHIKSLRPLC